MRRCAAYAAGSEILYVTLYLASDLRRHPALLLVCLTLLSLAYAALLPIILRSSLARREARFLAGAAVLFRLTLLPATPSLSDDIYRYLWDGRVLHSLTNPYRLAPIDPELASLRDDAWGRISYPELPTIYPPMAELLFGLGALFGPLRLHAVKGLMLLAELALALALHRLCQARGLGSQALLLYLLHPLPVLEIAHSGHVEPAAVAALAWAMVLSRRLPLASSCALAASILVKPFAVALVPHASRRLRARGLALVFALCAIAYLPFLSAGRNLGRSLWEYASRWRWYDSGFSLVLEAVRLLWPSPHDRLVARAIVVALFAAVLAVCYARRVEAPETALAAAAAFCFLTPTLHPWYLLWLLPWLSVRFSAALMTLATLLPFSYATFLWPAPSGAWEEPTMIKWATFSCVAGLLLIERPWRTARSTR